jgi:hypothetical protein
MTVLADNDVAVHGNAERLRNVDDRAGLAGANLRVSVRSYSGGDWRSNLGIGYEAILGEVPPRSNNSTNTDGGAATEDATAPLSQTHLLACVRILWPAPKHRACPMCYCHR